MICAEATCPARQAVSSSLAVHMTLPANVCTLCTSWGNCNAVTNVEIYLKGIGNTNEQAA
jgi:hypothetical protein